ncbi:MAG TPA: thiamine phosphate synthase [Candidatus Aminicenantes bacterium]|nr:thiamine phosphate synthase [Candidatus Aminicenantes bacterium]HRY66224.1 thiamine phosphate synthase [Candidatus Aminicenantes bacterium]HRZ73138.1 thiamine phosphate synthase [Candidatus Aminicenantes bacterium]
MAIDYSLYLVADAGYAAGRDLAGLVDAAVDGGVTIVQLRAKSLGGAAFAALASDVAARLARRGVPLLINDRVDVALACGAAGVHLGQDDLPVAAARRLLGPRGIIGLSVNTAEEARRAERDGADYVGAGPAFATSTKQTELAVLGPAGIGRIKAAVRLPVVAIGGIGAAGAAEMAAAGADGVAVVSAILGAPDARRAAEELKRAFEIQPKRRER